MPQLSAVAVAIFGALMVASAAAWIYLAGKLRRHEPLLMRRATPAVPWTLLDLVVLIVMSEALQIALAWAIGIPLGTSFEDFTPEQLGRTIFILSLTKIPWIFCAVVLLRHRWWATADDLGCPDSKASAARELKLGLVGFLVAVLPVYLLQIATTMLVPYKHPVLELLTQQPGIRFWLYAIFVSVLIAPLYEEFYFRLLLQGWLEKIEERMAVSATAQRDGTPPDASPSAPRAQPPGGMAILGSAGAFALMHLGHGLAPIPLFALGLILGYLYHQTHRILPCIVLHMLFNGFSLAMMWLSIAGDTPL